MEAVEIARMSPLHDESGDSDGEAPAEPGTPAASTAQEEDMHTEEAGADGDKIAAQSTPGKTSFRGDHTYDMVPMEFDDKLPAGWKRRLVQRTMGKSAGKYDVYIYSPEGKKFRSKTELGTYFSRNSIDLDADDFDFTVRGKHNTPKKPSTPKQKTPKPPKEKKTPKQKTPKPPKEKKTPKIKENKDAKKKAVSPKKVAKKPQTLSQKLVVKMNFRSFRRKRTASEMEKEENSSPPAKKAKSGSAKSPKTQKKIPKKENKNNAKGKKKVESKQKVKTDKKPAAAKKRTASTSSTGSAKKQRKNSTASNSLKTKPKPKNTKKATASNSAKAPGGGDSSPVAQSSRNIFDKFSQLSDHSYGQNPNKAPRKIYHSESSGPSIAKSPRRVSIELPPSSPRRTSTEITTVIIRDAGKSPRRISIEKQQTVKPAVVVTGGISPRRISVEQQQSPRRQSSEAGTPRIVYVTDISSAASKSPRRISSDGKAISLLVPAAVVQGQGDQN